MTASFTLGSQTHQLIQTALGGRGVNNQNYKDRL
jgi:hypothetical protein